MMRLKFSYLLILLAFGLSLNVPSLNANGTTGQEKAKNNLSPADGSHQQKTSNAQAQSSDPIPPKLNEQPAPTVQKNSTQDDPLKAAKADCPPLALSGTCADWAMVLMTFGAIIVGLCTLIAIRDQVHANSQSAEAALKTANHMAASERAYVKLSPVTPGISFYERMWTCGVNMRIKNFGRTPARVTYATMTFIVDDIGKPNPPQPLIGPQEPLRHFRAFLVSGEEIYHPQVKILGEADWISIRAGTKKLYIYGFVDYIDQFKNRHRAGFGASYEPHLDDLANYPGDSFNQRVNVFVLTERNYNYDRKRTEPGDGLDMVSDDPDTF